MTELIVEGHGLEDISCEHGSRWIWWHRPNGQSRWMNVVLAPGCECGEPPHPHIQPSSQEAKEQ